MVKLRVVSCRDSPLAEPLCASFNVKGGTIGRQHGSQLELPDETVSRLHARILLRHDHRFVIVDLGANPTRLNGQVITHGEEAPLADGDKLEIGPYIIVVETMLTPGNLWARPPASSAPVAVEPWPVSSFQYTGWNKRPGEESIVGEPCSDRYLVPMPAIEARHPYGMGDHLSVLFKLQGKLGLSSPWPPHQQTGCSYLTGAPRVPALSDDDIPTPRACSREAIMQDVVPADVNVGAVSGTSAPTHDHDADLLAAFKRGMSPLQAPLQSLTADVMQHIGTLLRLAVSGTVDLMLARAELRRQFGIAGTLLHPVGNNPLEHSPTAEAAVAHLLVGPTPGFMAGAEAMQLTYRQLRAHHYAMLTGMRAALYGAMHCFDPQQLDRADPATWRMRLFPPLRKAWLWQQYVDSHDRACEQATGEFDRLFAVAFQREYEAHVR